jgi:NO-binding membrane sensor protein with MHYT domain
MPQHYNHGLVLISLVVAILASYTALTLALRIRSTIASRQYSGSAWGAYSIQISTASIAPIFFVRWRLTLLNFMSQFLHRSDSQDGKRQK